MNESGQAMVDHGRTAGDLRPPDAAYRAGAIQTVLLGAAYLAAYVSLDWMAFIEHNPFANYAWNPDSGASFAAVLMFGLRMLPFMFIAPLLADLVTRHFSLPLPFELASAVLIGGIYAAAALFLLHPKRRFDRTLQSMSSLILLTFTVVVSAALVAAGYVGIVVASGLLPKADYAPAMLSYWIGDTIGIMVLTPFALVLWTRRYTCLPGRSHRAGNYRSMPARSRPRGRESPPIRCGRPAARDGRHLADRTGITQSGAQFHRCDRRDGARLDHDRGGARGHGVCEVRVRDSGPGFPPDRASNPFLPLSSTKKEGLGIGLSLCRSLIEAHGGRIWLDTDSPGTAVHFTLPVAKLAATRLSSRA
jgi:hypothetical protein